MKHLLRASVLGLPLLMVPTEAHAWGKGGYARKTDLGNKCVISFGSMPQAGPWYLYWPYEAHFNVSAPGFGTGCAPCGSNWAWMGGYGGMMGMDGGMMGGYGGYGGGYGGYGGGYGGYGGAPCPNGSCMNTQGYPQNPVNPQMPQNPALARPNLPSNGAQPAGFQPTAYMHQVPSYWYGK
jgi:hypothetical protein